jgi:hypothetical protein
VTWSVLVQRGHEVDEADGDGELGVERAHAGPSAGWEAERVERSCGAEKRIYETSGKHREACLANESHERSSHSMSHS